MVTTLKPPAAGWLALGLMAVLGLTACSSASPDNTSANVTNAPSTRAGAPRVQIDGPSYDTIAALASRADVVVLGKVQAKVSTATEGALPIAIYSVAVEGTLRGSVPAEIAVTRIDADSLSENLTPFEPGQRVILFLRGSGTTYSVVGLDQGVFDPSATEVWRSRGGLIPGLTLESIRSALG